MCIKNATNCLVSFPLIPVSKLGFENKMALSSCRLKGANLSIFNGCHLQLLNQNEAIQNYDIGNTFTCLDHQTSKPIKVNNKQKFFTHLCNGVLRLPSLLSMTAPYSTRSSTNVKRPCLAAKWSGDLDATKSMASMSAPCRNSKSTAPS